MCDLFEDDDWIFMGTANVPKARQDINAAMHPLSIVIPVSIISSDDIFAQNLDSI